MTDYQKIKLYFKYTILIVLVSILIVPRLASHLSQAQSVTGARRIRETSDQNTPATARGCRSAEHEQKADPLSTPGGRFQITCRDPAHPVTSRVLGAAHRATTTDGAAVDRLWPV